jgi:hypothetical protein
VDSMRVAFAIAGEVQRLAPLGAEAVVRVALALARATLVASPDRPGWRGTLDRALGRREQAPPDPALVAVVEAVERWIACPCEDHAAAAARTVRGPASEMTMIGKLASAPAWSNQRWGDDRAPAAYLTDRLSSVASDATYALWPRAGAATERILRDALAADVLPWALGAGDPLRARVAARDGRA